MPPLPPISSQIPVNALLALGTDIQAQMVSSAGAIGNTLLALEHAYGGTSFEEHLEAEASLETVSGRFRSFVSESSVAFLSTFVLTDFLQKQRSLSQDADYPSSLTDLLMGRKRHLRPANQTTSLFGLVAHLGGLAHIQFSLLRDSGNLSLYDPVKGCIVDFPAGKAEMQVAPAADPGEPARGEPLIALVAFHLAGLADVASETGMAARMYGAARMIYPE